MNRYRCDMKLCEFKYIFTIIGGGWVAEHELYAVTKDGKIYNTNKFDKLFKNYIVFIDEFDSTKEALL